ncbi:IS66 family transposase [Metasolibacillus sp. FSL H7-0170]|uniref:IS66 family transposase n=1 Tax=Metasolibacillus sp. FSL H7-0170 TaxID=2921431 RepID=UPI0031582E39
MNNPSQAKLIRLLEEQLAFTKEQNKQLTNQIDVLTEQVRQLTKMIYGSRSEKSKYQAPDGQCSLFDDDSSFSEPEHTGYESTETITYSVTRSKKKKKRNDSFKEGVMVEEIHHHPSDLTCVCCQSELHEIGSTLAREEAKFIPAKLIRVQHFEHAYECKHCKKDTERAAFIAKGKAPVAVIPRSIASPELLAKIVSDKFSLYLPLYRQVNELKRMGLETNDRNLSNWVIRVADDWLRPIYEEMKNVLSAKTLLHIDETTAQVLNRSDGKKAQSHAYNWVFRTVPTEGPVIILFHHALTRSREVLKEYLMDFQGTVICDGYSAYDKLSNIQFANCWSHVRRYWLKVESANGRKGLAYCNQLYELERRFKGLPPKQRQKMRWKYARKIIRKFFKWLEKSPFYGKNALATATEYTLNRKHALKAFLYNGQIEIDNNPAENAIRPSVVGRKNWLFSVSEAGARANAICLSLVETAKANGIDFYQYLVKLFTDLPNLSIHQQPELLKDYMPWSEKIQVACGKNLAA